MIKNIKGLIAVGILMAIGSIIVGCQQIEDVGQKDIINSTAKKVTSNISDENNFITGLFVGITPCADCEGIKQSLFINKNNTFRMTSEYLSKPKYTFEDTGTYEFDKTNKLLTLTNNYKFKAVGDELIMLDGEGNEMTGELAKYYVLTKLNLVGGDRDEHGCIGSAGYVWSQKENKCIRPWVNDKK